MRKRLLFLVLALCFAVSCMGMAEETAQDHAESYAAAIEKLNGYLGQQEGAGELSEIYASFEALGSYEFSPAFCQYIGVLMSLEGDNEEALLALQENTEFDAFLTAQKEEGAALGTVQELTAYAAGRQAESRKEYRTALDAYALCGSFMDAESRSEGITAMGAPTLTAPVLTLKNHDGLIVARWTSAGENAEYHIFRQRTKTEKEPTEIAVVEKLNYWDNAVVPNYSYRYFVVAVNPETGETIRSQAEKIVPRAGGDNPPPTYTSTGSWSMPTPVPPCL